MERVKIIIKGKVQGVFFRKSAKEAADKLGLKGYAENCDDGTVFIEAEGKNEDLEKFIEWCRKGPRLAEVTEVQFTKAGELKDFSGFRVK